MAAVQVRKHVVIAGTGRTGTTFLVELLTCLGLDTGFSPVELEGRKNKLARAGLEHDLQSDVCPYIVKSPSFHYQVDEVLDREDLKLERVLIPMRDLQAAAESRRYVHSQGLARCSFLRRLSKRLRGRLGFPGGLVQPDLGLSQETVLVHQLYNLVLSLADSAIPVTLLRYPRLARDPAYLFWKLKPILGVVTFPEFETVFQATVRPALVHCFSENDR